jgi:hypothetical protein
MLNGFRIAALKTKPKPVVKIQPVPEAQPRPLVSGGLRAMALTTVAIAALVGFAGAAPASKVITQERRPKGRRSCAVLPTPELLTQSRQNVSRESRLLFHLLSAYVRR